MAAEGMETAAAPPRGMVRVRLMGDLPSITGERERLVDLPAGSTLGDLLAELCRTYGEDFGRRIFSAQAKLQHTMLIFVDGENIAKRRGLAAMFVDGPVELY